MYPQYWEDFLPPHLIFTLAAYTYDALACIKELKLYGRYSFAWVGVRQLTKYFGVSSPELDRIMPRSSKGKQNDRTTATSTVLEWVNVPLPDDAEICIEQQWSDELAVVATAISRLVEGWAISIKPDSDKGEFACFITWNSPTSTGKGLGLSGRASDPLDALRVALYRVELVASGQFTPTAQSGKRRFR